MSFLETIMTDLQTITALKRMRKEVEARVAKELMENGKSEEAARLIAKAVAFEAESATRAQIEGGAHA